jgi:hypothetical protein
MASTYSTSLRLELIGTGEQSGTWGSTTNTNLGTLLEQAVGGYEQITLTDGTNTLTTANGATDQARNMVLKLVGTLSAARNVQCPNSIEKLYVVENATTGGFAITFKTVSGTGVTVPNGATAIVYADGTNVVAATNISSAGAALIDDASASAQRTTLGLGTIATQNSNSVTITGGSITGITDLAVADGGTGASNATSARTNLSAAGSGDVTASGLTQTTARLLGRTTASTGAIEELTAGRGLSLASGSLTTVAGSVLQVVTASTTTSTSISSNTYADTSLTATITPSATTSKILVLVDQVYLQVNGAASNSMSAGVRVMRDATAIATPISSTSPYELFLKVGASNIELVIYNRLAMTVLDSPSSTSALTYKTQAATSQNITFQPGNTPNGTSRIVLMEIAG